MIKNVYRRALGTLLGLPLRLWGISLLHTLLTALTGALAVVPILSIPLQLLLGLGMTGLFLRGLRGEEVKCDQLFDGFRGNVWRKLGGMAWMALWVFLWSLIPIAGIVLGIIKGYAYRFTPFILLTRPEVEAAEALKRSMAETRGRKGQMFAADLLPGLAVTLALLLLILLAQLPVIGFLFGLAAVLLVILSIAFLPLLYGLIAAAFYEEVQALKAAPAAEAPAPAAEAPAPAAEAPAPAAEAPAPAAETVPAADEAADLWDSGATVVLDPVPVLELPKGMDEADFEPVEPDLPVPEAPPVPEVEPQAPPALEFLPPEPAETAEPAAEGEPEARCCPNCGSPAGPGARFCRECGSPLN